MPEGWIFLPLAMLSAFTVGLSKGGLPVIGMLGVPILAFVIDPLTAAALLLPIYLVSDAYGFWLYRRAFSRRNLAILIPSSFIGILIGTLSAPYLSVAVMNVAIGVIGVSYTLQSWFFQHPDPAAKPARLVPGLFWGAVTGLTSFVSHSGGPPYQIYVLPQNLPKLTFAGTSTILFACINFAKLPPYLALGRFPPMAWTSTGLLALTAVIGVFAGSRLVRILPERSFFAAIRLALFILSLSLIWKGFTAA